VAPDLPATPYPNDWLEQRRSKLLFQSPSTTNASASWRRARLYADCAWPGARLRAIRVLERCGQPDAAFDWRSRLSGSREKPG